MSTVVFSVSMESRGSPWVISSPCSTYHSMISAAIMVIPNFGIYTGVFAIFIPSFPLTFESSLLLLPESSPHWELHIFEVPG